MENSDKSADCLLDGETIFEIEELETIPDYIIQKLNDKYLQRENDIEYIYYTGLHCNSNNKHTLDQFLKIGEKFGFHGSWPCIVVFTGAGVVWKNGNEIYNLINKIFRYFETKELEINDQYIYCTRQEFDANNVNYFEEMSNAFLIGIKTKFHDSRILNVLISLFESVISNNFYRFENIDDSIYFSQEERDIPYKEYEISKIKKYDMDLWIDILMNLDIQMDTSDIIPDEVRDNLLHNYKTGKLTHPELNLLEQKYFNLSELHADLKIRLEM